MQLRLFAKATQVRPSAAPPPRRPAAPHWEPSPEPEHRWSRRLRRRTAGAGCAVPAAGQGPHGAAGAERGLHRAGARAPLPKPKPNLFWLEVCDGSLVRCVPPVFSAGPRPLSRTGIPGCVLSQCWGTGRGRRWRFWGVVEVWCVFGALAAALSPGGPRRRGGPLARTFQIPKSMRARAIARDFPVIFGLLCAF